MPEGRETESVVAAVAAVQTAVVGVGVGMAVGLGVAVGAGVAVGLGVAVGTGVGVVVGLGIAVGTGVGVAVSAFGGTVADVVNTGAPMSWPLHPEIATIKSAHDRFISRNLRMFLMCLPLKIECVPISLTIILT